MLTCRLRAYIHFWLTWISLLWRRKGNLGSSSTSFWRYDLWSGVKELQRKMMNSSRRAPDRSYSEIFTHILFGLPFIWTNHLLELSGRFLVQMSYQEAAFVRCLAYIVKSYKWRKVIAIYEESLARYPPPHCCSPIHYTPLDLSSNTVQYSHRQTPFLTQETLPVKSLKRSYGQWNKCTSTKPKMGSNSYTA